MRKVVLFFLLILATLFSIYILTNDTNTEKKIAQCINKILDDAKIDAIDIDTKDRGSSPIIKGIVSKQHKAKVLSLLKGQCGITELQDFVEIKTITKVLHPWLNFKIDNVNNIITVSGQVHSQSELDDILTSFATNDKTVVHNLSVNELISASDYAIYSTLIMASADNIQLADITINKGEIILKGLVRDKIRERETLLKLQQIFTDEMTIINQLELVVKHRREIEGLKFDLAPMPILQPPNKTNNIPL
ncbi:MAG: hypothetical protein JKY19_10320 [Alcanivoracaceae bacterium]|nr:hypothetical protein [Alcanivoracaceae bacterium]